MATDTTLNFILQAQNRVGSQITELKNQIAGVGKTTEETAGSTGKLGGAFSGMAAQFVVGSAVFSAGQKVLSDITGTIQGGVKAYEDWQTQQARAATQTKQVGTIQGVTKDQLVELAEATQKHTAVSRDAVLTGENMLDTYGNISKSVLPQATDALTRLASATNGGVIPSAQQMNTTAIQLGIALNDPATAYTRLRREGVTFTAQQQEQLKTMVKGGDTLGAQKLLLKAIDDQYGSLSGQTNTWKFQLAQLHNTINDFIGAVISKVLPALQKFGEFLLKHKPLLAAVAGGVAGLAVAIGVALVTALWGVVAPAIAAVLALWPIIAVGAAVGLVAYEIATHWDTVKQWFHDFMEWIKANWPLIVDILLGPFGIIITTIIKHWGTIKGAFQDAWNFVTGLWSGLAGFFSGVWQGVRNAVGQVGTVLSGVFKDAFNTIIDLWDNTMGKLFHGQRISAGPVHFDLPNLMIPKLAIGTDMFAGGLALVGENGPELVNLPQGAGVTPAAQTSQLLQAGRGQAPVSLTFAPQIGLYAGMPSEKRKIAVDLYTEVVREARAHGVQLPTTGSVSVQ